MNPVTRPRPVPRWAWIAAYAAPLSVLPSCLWRLLEVAPTSDPGTAWYMWVLSCLEFGTALLTIGLVHRWGEVWPRWLPGLGGRTIAPRTALVPGWIGAVIVTLLTLYGGLNSIFGFVGRGPVLIGDATQHVPALSTFVVWLYVPSIAWPVLLIASLIGYRARRAAQAA